MIPIYTRKIIALLPLLAIWTLSVQAQNFSMDGTPITSCTGFFTDSGGNDSYSASESLVTTICSDASAGSHVRLNFSAVEVMMGDELCFYDGEDTTAPLLSCASDFNEGDPFIIQATIENTSGCITVSFDSDGSGQGEGWSALIECVPACQRIEAALINSDPTVMPADTGWINACPGQRLIFEGQGTFPQEGLFYEHEATSSYIWDMGDGTVAFGPQVDHVYEESGGYVVQLTIVDQLGCRSTNFISQRVRVSTQPDFNLTGDIPTEICAGDTIGLSASVNEAPPTGILSVTSNEGTFQAAATRSDSLALPDGTGATYETSVQFSEFSPGQVLENVGDLLGICVNIEHSWMRDMEISLSCPDGRSVILHDHPGNTGGAVFLGEPIDGDDANPVPGTGYDYCWTPDAAQGTWIQYANANNPNTLPEGDYNAFDDLADLVGCPLNGEWTITVEDRWAIDNGFIFSWGINFSPDIYPSLETFMPEVVSSQWLNNSSVLLNTADTLSASPQNAGMAAYIYQVTDDYGCVYDTAITYNVLPTTDPNCYSCENYLLPLRDTALCDGGTVQLNAGPTRIENPVGFETFPMYDQLGNQTHPPSMPYASPLEISGIAPNILDDPLASIQSICIDITTAPTDWVSDLSVFLEAPSGERIELTSGNGANGSNYTNTCFTPTATDPITGGTAPFTGTFSPEGNWNDLQDATVNGEWRLLVSDSGGPLFGTLNSWSIVFNAQNTITYTWDNSPDLSCTDCPDPVVTPSGSVAYMVNATDTYGCSFSDTVTVTAIDDIPAPIVTCGLTGEGEITFNWEQLDGISSYEVNVNGLGWVFPNNGELSHTVSGLGVNEEVSIEVRAFTSGATGCTVATGAASCINDVCALTASIIGEPTDVSCFGEADGVVNIELANGTAPYTFLLDSMTTYTTPTIDNIPAGNHIVYVEDADGCTDFVAFIIEEPQQLTLNATITEVNCNGGDDGAIEIQTSGGTGTTSFNWSNNAIGNEITELMAGDYELVVTDENGCTLDTVFTLAQPDSLLVDLTTVAAFCNNSTDGSVTAEARGGAGNFTYNWSNGATTSSIDDLMPGQYCVTVSDANGCTRVACTEVTVPDPLIVASIQQEPVLCFGGNTGKAIVEIEGGAEPYTYQWNDDLSQISDTAVFLTAGLYEVLVTDANGCDILASIEVEQPEQLTIDLATDPVNCFEGSDGTATANVSGGTMPFTYVWSDTLAQTTAMAEDLAAGNYEVSVTDANGCEMTASVEVNQPNSPVLAQVQQSFEGCFGERDNEARAVGIGGTGSDYSYAWSDGQTTATATGLDTVSYTVTVMDENGCEAISSIQIDDLDSLRLNIAANEPTCNGLSDGEMAVNFLSGGAGGPHEYIWGNQETTAFINGLEGGRTYRVTVTDAQGCSKAIERFLSQPTAITLETDSQDVRCFDGEDGIARVVRAMGRDTIFEYLWDGNAQNQTLPTATGLSAGTYSVTVTDPLGCEAETEVTVNQPEPLDATFTTEDNLCFGNQEGSIATAVRGGVGDYAFNWSTGETFQTIGKLGGGVYNVTITDGNQCELIESVEIFQPDPLAVGVTPEPITCFGGRDGGFLVQTNGGTAPYTYSLDGTENFSSNNQFIGLESGEYDIFVRDANGCTLFETAFLEDPPQFLVNTSPNNDFEEISFGDTVTIWANSENATGEVKWQWFSDGGDSTFQCRSNCTGIFIYPTTTTYYTLVGTDEAGCESNDRVQIRVRKNNRVLVPTGFSPNFDDVNDLLLVHGTEGVRVTVFRVYDRWGELLYESGDFMVNDEEIGWDGSFRGEQMPTGVYVWYAEVEYPDGMTEQLKGKTTLIR